MSAVALHCVSEHPVLPASPCSPPNPQTDVYAAGIFMSQLITGGGGRQ